MHGETLSGQVLLVDTNVKRSELLSLTLSAAGYRVSQASSRRDALWRLRGPVRLPAVIVLDPDLPEMNAFEFRDHQSQSAAWAAVPVLLLHSDPATSVLAQAMGAVGMLDWPTELGHALRVIGSVVQGHGEPTIWATRRPVTGTTSVETQRGQP